MTNKVSTKALWSVIVVVSCLIGIGFGHKSMLEYESTAATSLAAAEAWPPKCDLSHNSWTLVMAAHPNCPCSRATMNELNRVLAKTPVKLQVYALFFRPANSVVAWNKSDLWRNAENLRGVTPIDDPGGKKSDLFNATTSGEVYLYNPGGRLLFHGGITGSRGHEGDNPGEDMVLNTLSGKPSKSLQETPVYGCSIR